MTILGDNNMISKYQRHMISMLCYELYKVDWKHKHMITADREMDSIKNYYKALTEAGLDEGLYAYHYYLEEFGYDGELYVCYKEFYEYEYRDNDYMCSLLDNEELINMYYKAIKE